MRIQFKESDLYTALQEYMYWVRHKKKTIYRLNAIESTKAVTPIILTKPQRCCLMNV